MNLKYLMRPFYLNVKWSFFSKIDPIRNVSRPPPSVEKSGIHFPENVLTWVLSHLVGGTPYISIKTEKDHIMEIKPSI